MKKSVLIAFVIASVASGALAAGKPNENGRPGTDGTDNPGAIIGDECKGPKRTCG
ncbi:hypothetical protein [Aliiroseovarius sp. PrR006]|uniref:hypothetical protein n=1 Tax=Aliiroseovarius sp. PrR006 TaxID=2706883 RepID=UPI0013D5E74D|nr:hypothetical protein [Aliiroseovarius sp. PrR006]NDW52200.1 hypothetical protein [Aliiroseovarius sp. PrR006]